MAGIAAGQLGLFTRAQAHGAGVTRWELHHRVAAGAYEHAGCGVFAVGGIEWTWNRRLLAALLTAGPTARASHRAAAHLLGFDGFGECPIELTVPRSRRARTELATVHRTSFLHPLDLVRVGRFPVTSAARTIIDLCSCDVGSERLTAAIGSALRDGYTSEEFLRRRLAQLRGPGRRGVRLLDRVLKGPIGHSHLERTFLALVRKIRLPVPRTQVIVEGERVMRVDVMWDAERVVVELMGHRFHVTPAELQRDAQRRNELQELGNLVIELTSKDVAERPTQSIGRVARNLARRRPQRSGDDSVGRANRIVP